jgi:hypothetical protein
MNPEQQGYYQPNSGQQPQPTAPPQPVQQAPRPAVQPQQFQPAVAPQAPQPAVAAAPVAAAPVAEQQDVADQEEYDEEYEGEPVTWVAHEYIHQEKGAMWFVLFTLIIAALLAVSVFVMNSWSFAAVLVVIAIVVVVYTRRPPRELTYLLTDEGLAIDGKMHPFADFKSFGVIRDGEEYSVMLIPTQRFQPGVTVYFPEEAGEDIVDMLGSRLPMKDLKLDMVDRAVRLLRL